MSAWIVSKRHIDYMVTAIIAAGISDMSPDALGRMLWRTNLASVACRYGHLRPEAWPAPAGFRRADVDAYTWQETPLLTGGALAKTLGCYEYQSCEHSGWAKCRARALVAKMRAAIGDVPYDEQTPWGWE